MGTFADFLDDVETEKPQSKNVPAPIRNNNPGALMPGGKLAQYKTPEEGLAALDKNLASYGKKGVSTLADVISKWAPPNENDTNAYIAHVAKVAGLDPNQKIDLSNPLIRHQISAGIVQHENGTKAIYQPSAQTKSTPSDFASFLEDVGETPSQAKSVAPVVQQTPQVIRTNKNMDFDVGQGNSWDNAPKLSMSQKAIGQVLNAKQQAPAFAANALDLVAGLPGQAARSIDYFARLHSGETPEQAQSNATSDIGRLTKPVGTLTQTLQQPAYENNVINKLMNLGGEYVINPGVQKVAQMTGSNPINVAETLNAVGLAAPVVGKTMGAIGKGIREASAELKAPLKTEIAQPSEVMAGSTGAAKAQNNPFAGEITGEEKANRELFPAYKLSKSPKDASVREQNIRSEVASTINPNGRVREGVITGNENTLRNEHQEAKNPDRTPKGELLRQQIAEEQNALSDFAQKRIEATGASPSLTNDEQRGMKINDVFYGKHEIGAEEPTSLKGFLQEAKQTIFKDAKDKIGDTPIETNHVDTLLKNPQWNASLKLHGTTEVAQGAAELIKLAKEVGFADKFGNVYPPGSVSAFDAVRKRINASWTHEKASTISDINSAIDRDIAEVADPKLYKLGDRIHQAEQHIYEAEGLKKLFGETDQNGIVKSTTPNEKIPSKLNNLRKDQWRHVRGTLEDLSKGIVRGAPEGLPPVPESLRKSAKSALAEIDGALAREVYNAGGGRAGVWNQNDVNKMLNSVVGEKIAETFSPSEVRNYHVLNVGGHIMPGIHGYEGGAAQAQRIEMLASHAPKIGAAVGTTVGGVISGGNPYVAAAGGYVGKNLGTSFRESSLQNALNKAATETEKNMQKNAKRPSILNLRENKKD